MSKWWLDDGYMMARWCLDDGEMMASEQQPIFTNITHSLTYQGTLRNTYGVNNVNILVTECGIMLENVVILFLIHPPLRKNFPHQYFIFRTPVLRVHVSAPDWGEGLANDKFTVSLIEARAKNFDFTNSSVQSLMDQTYVYTNMYKWRFETIDLGSYILFIDLCVDWKYLTEQYHGK